MENTSYEDVTPENSSDDSTFSDESSDVLSSKSELEEFEEEKTQNIEWKRYSRQNKVSFTLPTFTEGPSINNDLKCLYSPYEFFELYFHEDVYNDICELTDNYYKNKKINHRRKSHHKKWEKPDVITMKCYFGQLLYMGIVRKPSLNHYLSTSSLFGSSGFSELLSEDHFRDIHSSLQFVDEVVENWDDPLYKVRPLIAHIIKVSQTYYIPDQNLTIDESMIRFNGRNKMKVFMPLKPIKYGFKAYILAEASSGFMLNWTLHDSQKRTLTSIVEELVKPYANKGFALSMDRFYTSLDVVRYLTRNNFGIYGAIMKNRVRLATDMQNEIEKLEKHGALFYTSSDHSMLLTIWRDSRIDLVSNVGQNTLSVKERNCKNVSSNIIKKSSLNVLILFVPIPRLQGVSIYLTK